MNEGRNLLLSTRCLWMHVEAYYLGGNDFVLIRGLLDSNVVVIELSQVNIADEFATFDIHH